METVASIWYKYVSVPKIILEKIIYHICDGGESPKGGISIDVRSFLMKKKIEVDHLVQKIWRNYYLLGFGF